MTLSQHWKIPWSTFRQFRAAGRLLYNGMREIIVDRFVGPIRGEVEEWQKNLMLFQETLDEWLAVQRNWVYVR